VIYGGKRCQFNGENTLNYSSTKQSIQHSFKKDYIMPPTDRMYSEEEKNKEVTREVSKALAESHRQNFEKKTQEILSEIDRRLDEANDYKATIGSDVKDLKRQIQAQDDNEHQKYVWWQDRWVRIGIVFSVIWEVINILQGFGVMNNLHHP
jgi:hypothetical protein